MTATEKTGITVGMVGGHVRFDGVRARPTHEYPLDVRGFFEMDAELRGVAVTLAGPYWYSQPGDADYRATVWQVESIASGAPEGRYYLHLKRPELVVYDRAYGDSTPEAVLEWKYGTIECEIHHAEK